MKAVRGMVAGALLAMAGGAMADINIGVILPMTGPLASLGLPAKNAVRLFPETLGGEKLNFILLDDASDPTAATLNMKKLIQENKVDAIIGSLSTPNSLAMVPIAAEAATPMISLSASSRITQPVDEKKRWVFKTAQTEGQMMNAIVAHMKANQVKTVAFIGFSDAYGEAWLDELKRETAPAGIQLVATERFAKNDVNVAAQVIKIMAAKPDAVMVAGAGTPAALPHIGLVERGYKKLIYQTHGVANLEFLRIGGKALEGGYLPTSPLMVLEQLPENHAVKKSAGVFVAKYEAMFGPNTRSSFAGSTWDAWQLLERTLPLAKKSAAAGTPQFRLALRNELEKVANLPAAIGVYDMSPTDHIGLDQRSRVIVKIENGTWKLAH